MGEFPLPDQRIYLTQLANQPRWLFLDRLVFPRIGRSTTMKTEFS
jgi:hypothetical protein